MDIDRSKVVLDFPAMAVCDSYIAALQEGFHRGAEDLKKADEIQKIKQDFAAYIKKRNAPPEGKITAPTGEEFEKVPYETLWLVADDIFIGEISFRHKLNDMLYEFGGHVGYGIRPSLQNQGYATLALALTRERAAQMGMNKLLVTCSPDNPASEKVILKNGGIHENTLENPYGFGPTKRFWICTKNV